MNDVDLVLFRQVCGFNHSLHYLFSLITIMIIHDIDTICTSFLLAVFFFKNVHLLSLLLTCEGGYLGLWAWLRLSASSGWTKVRDHVTTDPRFEVIIPLPVRRVVRWIFMLDGKVTWFTH